MKHGVAPPSSQPGQDANGHQHGNGIGKHRQYRETADQQHRDNQQCLAAEAIRQRAEGRGTDGRPDQRR